MDPVSLVTAVITIGGVSVTAARFADIIYRSINDARMFDQEIDGIALVFKAFAGAIQMTERSLKRVCQMYSTSTVVDWIVKKGLATNLVHVSRDIDGQIQSVTDRFERVSRRQGLLAFGRKMWWSRFHKADIDKLHPRMESLKTLLLLVYEAIKLEMLMALVGSPEVRAEIQELKQTLKEREETIKTLRRQHLIHQQSSPGSRHGDAAKSGTNLAIEQLDVATRMLLKLGETLQEAETVAEIGPKLRQSTTRRPRRPRPQRGGASKAPRRRPEPGSSARNPAPPPPPSRPPSPRPGPGRRTRPEVVIPESVLQRFEANAAGGGSNDHAAEAARRDSTVSAQSTVPTRADSSSSSARSTPETPITPLTPPAPAAESSFTDVRESRNYHSLVGLEGGAIQGYLGRRAGESHLAPKTRVVAHRFREALDENFITIRKARESDLDIEPLDLETEAVVLEVAKGTRLPVVGTVEATWSSSTSYPPKFRLKMWVVDGQLPDKMSIALGRPFEKRNRYYKSAPSVSERE